MRLRITGLLCVLGCALFGARLWADGVFIEGRHTSLSVVPAPGAVKIDGKLDDWDLSGEILTYENLEFAPHRFARTAMMYDKDYLYVSAYFKDSTPMHHLMDGHVDASWGWDGDALQLKMNTDPSVGYPMQVKTEQPIGRDVQMWYCDAPGRNEPQMCIQTLKIPPRGGRMSYSDPRWIFYGADTQMAFARQEGGYTLEARLPWKRLGMTEPPTPGTKLAFTTQHIWGNDAGTHYSTSINDVTAPGGGFTYQSCDGWGYLLFEGTGHLARAREEIPQAVEMAKTLAFTYTVPTASKVSMGIFDADGKLVRTLLTATDRPAGTVTEAWDGLNDFGDVLPAGKYTFKALTSHGFTQDWVVSVKNAGTPPWTTADGTGSWGMVGIPTDIACAGDRVYLLWGGGEGGNNLQACTLDGKKLWGNTPYGYNGGFADALATDGKTLFIAQNTGISQHDAATGRPLNFPGEKRGIDIPGGGITDLALLNGHLYAAANGHLYDILLAKGLIVRTFALGDGARGLQVAPDGATLLFLRSGALSRFHTDSGMVENVFPVELGKPFGLAVSPDGKRVYISDQGRVQMDIRVYSYPGGKALGYIGKPGGRPAIGKFNPNGLFMPGRMAFDSKGRLWVAEMDTTPNRFSVWATTGKQGVLVKDFMGPAALSGTSFIDPEHPEYLYTENMRWIVDYEKKTAKIDCTYARPGWDGPQPGSSSWMPPPRVEHLNGRTFLVFPGSGSVWEMLADHAVPLYAANNMHRIPGWPVEFKFDDWNYHCYWSDTNHNGFMDANEIEVVRYADMKANPAVPPAVIAKDDHLAFERSGGMLVGVKEWREGVPIYYRDYEVKPGFKCELSTNWPTQYNPDRTRLYAPETNDGYYRNDMRKNGIACYTADGQKLWRFKAGIGMDCSAPVTKPGEIRGAQKFIGFIETGADKGGELIGVNGYWGDYNLINEDGLFVTELCTDNRRGTAFGPNVLCCENFNGWIFRHPKTGKVYLIGGDIDVRIWEIGGFDGLRRFTGTLEITDKDVASATQAAAAYQQAVGTRVTNFTLQHLDKPPTLDGSLASWDMSKAMKIDVPGRGGKALAAYDDKYLYVAYRVADDSPFTNGGGDPTLLFKTGDLVDVILCTQAGADPKRTVGKGDTRILFAPFQGKPVAVVMQKVAQGGPAAPVTITSSQAPETFERAAILTDAKVAVKTTPDGYLLEAAVPLAAIGFHPEKGKSYPFDFGILYGDPGGKVTILRAYWTNQDTQITNDPPTESRIQPANLGTANAE